MTTPDPTPPFKFKNAALLNRLSEMAQASYYATACQTLIQAEMVIVELERENSALRAEVERLAAQSAPTEPTVTKDQRELIAKPVGFVVLDHFGPNKHFFSSFYETRNTEREWVPVYAGRAIPATSKTDGGMVLRDHFAARAMAALLTRVDVVAGDYVTNATPDDAATSAYRYADAMLRAKE